MKDKKYYIGLISKHCSGMYNSDLLITANGLEELADKLSHPLEAEVKPANGGRKHLTSYEEFMSVTDKIYDAVVTARKRFGQLNGQVTPEVWNDNYEAMKKLSDAIDLFEKEDSRLSV